MDLFNDLLEQVGLGRNARLQRRLGARIRKKLDALADRAREQANSMPDAAHEIETRQLTIFQKTCAKASEAVTQKGLSSRDKIHLPWQDVYHHWQESHRSLPPGTDLPPPDLDVLAEEFAAIVFEGGEWSTLGQEQFQPFTGYAETLASGIAGRVAPEKARRLGQIDEALKELSQINHALSRDQARGDPALLTDLAELPRRNLDALQSILRGDLYRCETVLTTQKQVLSGFELASHGQSQGKKTLAAIFRDRLGETYDRFTQSFLNHRRNLNPEKEWKNFWSGLNGSEHASKDARDLGKQNRDGALFQARVRGLFELGLAASEQDGVALPVKRKSQEQALKSWFADASDGNGSTDQTERPSLDLEEVYDTKDDDFAASFIDWVPLPQRLAFTTGASAKGQANLSASKETKDAELFDREFVKFFAEIAGREAQTRNGRSTVSRLLLDPADVRRDNRLKSWGGDLKANPGWEIVRNWLEATARETGEAKLKIDHQRGIVLTNFRFGSNSPSSGSLLLDPQTLSHVALAITGLVRMALSLPLSDAGIPRLNADKRKLTLPTTTVLPCEIEAQSLRNGCSAALKARSVVREADLSIRQGAKAPRADEALVARYGTLIDDHMPLIGRGLQDREIDEKDWPVEDKSDAKLQDAIGRMTRHCYWGGGLLAVLFIVYMLGGPALFSWADVWTTRSYDLDKTQTAFMSFVFLLLAGWRVWAVYRLSSQLDPERKSTWFQPFTWLISLPCRGPLTVYLPALLLLAAGILVSVYGFFAEDKPGGAIFAFTSVTPLGTVLEGLIWALPAIGLGLLAHGASHLSTVVNEAYEGPQDEKTLAELKQLCQMAKSCASELGRQVKNTKLSTFPLDQANAALENATTRVTARFDRWRNRNLRNAAIWIGLVSGLAILGPLNSFRPDTTDELELIFGAQSRDPGGWTVSASLDGAKLVTRASDWLPQPGGATEHLDFVARQRSCENRVRKRLQRVIDRAPDPVLYALMQKELMACQNETMVSLLWRLGEVLGEQQATTAAIDSIEPFGPGHIVPCARENGVAASTGGSSCLPGKTPILLKSHLEIDGQQIDISGQGSLADALNGVEAKLPIEAQINRLKLGQRPVRQIPKDGLGALIKEELEEAVPELTLPGRISIPPEPPFAGASDPLWHLRREIETAEPLVLDGVIALRGVTRPELKICGGAHDARVSVARLLFDVDAPLRGEIADNDQVGLPVPGSRDWDSFARFLESAEPLGQDEYWHVIGYASSTGPAHENLRLAARRAAATAQAVQQSRPKGEEIRWSGGGEYRLSVQHRGVDFPSHDSSQAAVIYRCSNE